MKHDIIAHIQFPNNKMSTFIKIFKVKHKLETINSNKEPFQKSEISKHLLHSNSVKYISTSTSTKSGTNTKN